MTIDLLSQLLGTTSGLRTARLTPPHLDDLGAVPDNIAPEPGAPGAALDDVLAHVRAHVPSASGLLVQGGRLFVLYGEPPDDAARTAARAALADPAALSHLAARSATTAAASPARASGEDLRTPLLDPLLSDEAWLRAFRRYQVAQLSVSEGGPDRADRADRPDRPE